MFVPTRTETKPVGLAAKTGIIGEKFEAPHYAFAIRFRLRPSERFKPIQEHS